MIRAKYSSKEKNISFTYDKVYECELNKDGFGPYYDILDDSGEWYRYSVDFFKKHFEVL